MYNLIPFMGAHATSCQALMLAESRSLPQSFEPIALVYEKATAATISRTREPNTADLLRRIRGTTAAVHSPGAKDPGRGGRYLMLGRLLEYGRKPKHQGRAEH